MWYIFPSSPGLGSASMSQQYAINSRAESRRTATPSPGPRLVAICEAALAVEGRSAFDIFGSPDDLKLKSAATLLRPCRLGLLFDRLLLKFFGGTRDDKTLRLLGATHDAD